MKYCSITTAIAVLFASIGMAAAASPFEAVADQVQSARVHGDSIAANGRCGGISYGTGARTCGTMTGGPVGGLTSRN